MYLLKGIIMSSQDHPVSPLKDKIISSLPYTLAVAIIGFVALWIRILPSNTVFLSNGFVKFVSNDAWYHMRTFNLLLNNYPNRIFFNPMTEYPKRELHTFRPLIRPDDGYYFPDSGPGKSQFRTCQPCRSLLPCSPRSSYSHPGLLYRKISRGP